MIGNESRFIPCLGAGELSSRLFTRKLSDNQIGRSSGWGFTEILPIDEAKTLLNSGNISVFVNVQ